MNKTVLMTLAALAALPAPSAAQAAADSKAVYDFGRCVVKADRAVGARLLVSLPYEGEAGDYRSQLTGDSAKCAGAAPAGVTAQLLRGALAQEMFKKDFKEFGMPPETPAYRLAKLELPIEDDAAVSPETRNLYKLAECTVRNDGARVEYLLATPVDSSRERMQFDNLARILSVCKPEGGSLNISRSAMRSAIAVAAYQVAARFATGDLAVRHP